MSRQLGSSYPALGQLEGELDKIQKELNELELEQLKLDQRKRALKDRMDELSEKARLIREGTPAWMVL